MKMSAIKVDSALAEQGDWVNSIPDLPGIRIKARGSDNRDYRILEAKLVRQMPSADRVEGLTPEDQDRIAGTLLLETVVIDVEGLTEDDEVTPVKYTKEIGAVMLLDNDFKVFRAGCAYAGSVVARRRKVDKATETKN